jgi:hypothetical protein
VAGSRPAYVRAGLALAVALGVFHAVAFAWVAVVRAKFPFDLEWMEGGELLHAREVLAGRALYADASADFAPLPYEPLHTYAVAAAARVFGLSYATGRGVSFCAAALFAALTAAIVKRETRRPALAWGAGAASFVLFPMSHFWTDLVRVDMLFLAVLLGAIGYARAFASRRESWLVGALLLYVAFYTKQLASVFLPVLVVAIGRKRGVRAALACGGAFVALIALDRLVGNAITGGRYGFTTVFVPSGQPLVLRRAPYALLYLLSDAGPGVLLALLYVALRARAVRQTGGLRRLLAILDGWPLAILCGALATLLAFLHPGGAVNNVLTVEMFFPIVGAIVVDRALRLLRRPELSGLAIGLAAAQLAILVYDPRAHVPSPAAYAAEARLDSFLRDAPGPVLVPDHPFAALEAGKAPSYQTCTLWERRYRLGDRAFPDDLRAKIRDRAYAVVLTARDAKAWPELYPKEIAESYRRGDDLEWTDPLECPSGARGTQPRVAYYPKDAPAPR